MDQPDREVERHFALPYRQIITMVLVLVLVGFGAYLAYPKVSPIFAANPYLNGFIGLVFVIGVLACFWQVFQLVSS
ncbi:biopolymer transporter ExbB, partial [Rhodobacteraceae bacterium]|nr:biopolymer transporter ExbB [Paracoccaceae bacterium]